jgi:PAS domain S-box-containing protein
MAAIATAPGAWTLGYPRRMPTADFLLRHTSDAVIVLDEDLVLRQVNDRAALLYRRPATELAGRALLALFPEIEGTDGLRQLREAAAGTVPRRFELFVPSLFAWHAVLAVPDGAQLVLFARDVSDRVRREGEEAARAAVRKVIETMPLCVTITRGAQHRIEQSNHLARALVGHREVDGELVERVLPEAREQGFIDLLDRVFATGEAFRGEEVTLRWKPEPEGEERQAWFDLVYHPLRGENGTTDGILHLATDVTEKVQRRLLLERYALERQAVLEHLEEGVIVTDEAGRINFVNEAAERMHGIRLLGIGPDDYTSAYSLLTDAGDPHPSHSLPLARAVRERAVVKDAVWKIRRSDGTVLRVRGTAKPVFGSDGALLASVLTLVPWPH